jgi:hypothetical protein
MTQPNRPAARFQVDQQVWTPADRAGWIDREPTWADGEWTYRVMFISSDKILRYAEHELTEAGR